MYYDFLVKIPENTGKISKNKRKDVTYIEYTYDRKYIPEKKYNIPLRTTIGKMNPSDPTMMYPNANFEKYFPDVMLPDTEKDASRSSCIRVGAFLVIKKIIDDYKLQDYLSSWDDVEKDCSWICQRIPLSARTTQPSIILIMHTIIQC